MPEHEPGATDNDAGLKAVRFHDPQRAKANLARIRATAPAGLANVIPLLLAETPDPDSALNYFERLCDTGGPELIQMLDRHHFLAHYALMVFGYSQYLSETLLQNPDIFQTLQREGSLDRTHSHEEFREAFARFRSRSFETDISLLLARFKKRESVRIMLRDAMGSASLAETTAEISALSDVLVEEALQACEAAMHRKYGAPQHRDRAGRLVNTPFTVLALGKLGGKELNYNSDIDLFFLYGDGESDEGGSITNREYFVRLGQQVTSVLSQVTREGFVFRIDLRLRPQGREGEAAIPVGQALQYYSAQAHDWECQALIKVRYCAGDEKLARHFIRGVQERIYTERVNFAAIETALKALERMRAKKTVGRGDHDGIDVKHHPGGIRDIEFLVQCLQRVYGGEERWLRSGGTLFSLQKLHDKRHISGSDFHLLTTVYEFLRCLEHRLQLRHGQQTHRLPKSDQEMEILARSLRHPGAEPYLGSEMAGVVRNRMVAAREVYDRIIHHHQQEAETGTAGKSEPEREIEFGRVPTDHQVLMRLRADSPALFDIAARTDLEPHTRRNLFKFLSSAFTSAERYQAVVELPGAVATAVELFRRSEYLTDILAQHPENARDLYELRATAPRHQTTLIACESDMVRGKYSDELEAFLASDDIVQTDAMVLLRRRFRYRMFLSGARDVIESRPVFASLADTSAAADEAIRAAWAASGRPDGLAILALGRLGTNEFDALSDADLLFVRDSRMSAGAASRCTEVITQVLSAYTNEGSVMSVDLRLRPHGADGGIVSTAEELEKYFRDEASAWEALTYTKLRCAAGDANLAAEAITSAELLRDRFADDPSFATEVRRMRAKLEKSQAGLKVSPGGLYDIDFLTGYSLIRQRMHTVHGTTADRLQKLGQADAIAKPDLQALLDALELFRATEHAIRIATGRATKMLPIAVAARENVEAMTRRAISRDLGGDLEAELDSARSITREIFDRLIT